MLTPTPPDKGRRPELLRRGRFDEVFFLDLPTESERKEIFEVHILKRKRLPDAYDLQRLAQAYAALARSGNADFDLVLAGGPGWLSDDLVAGLDALAADCRLRRLGYVPDDDLPALYAGARMFCFPSLYEGFGLPVLEAQSYGAPVMTANRSALPEIAGDAALYVDPTDVDAIAAGRADVQAVVAGRVHPNTIVSRRDYGYAVQAYTIQGHTIGGDWLHTQTVARGVAVAQHEWRVVGEAKGTCEVQGGSTRPRLAEMVMIVDLQRDSPSRI